MGSRFGFLILGALSVAPGMATAATILQRSGPVNAQCCEFSAFAFGWQQTTTWTNVRIELTLYNNGNDPAPNTGVAYLTTKLGPGTTEAAHEIDEAVLAVSGNGPHDVEAVNGLTLGPGTYYVTYFRASHGFNDFAAAAWNTNNTAPQVGPGVTFLGSRVEDLDALYPPASSWVGFADPLFLASITGTQVPEPSAGALVAAAAALFGVITRRKPS